MGTDEQPVLPFFGFMLLIHALVELHSLMTYKRVTSQKSYKTGDIFGYAAHAVYNSFTSLVSKAEKGGFMTFSIPYLPHVPMKGKFRRLRAMAPLRNRSAKILLRMTTLFMTRS